MRFEARPMVSTIGSLDTRSSRNSRVWGPLKVHAEERLVFVLLHLNASRLCKRRRAAVRCGRFDSRVAGKDCAHHQKRRAPRQPRFRPAKSWSVSDTSERHAQFEPSKYLSSCQHLATRRDDRTWIIRLLGEASFVRATDAVVLSTFSCLWWG